MSGDIFDIDQGDKETITGTLHDPGATPGDVLTVQADGSVAAAPGGGSTPFNLRKKDIAFDTPGLAAGIELFVPEVGEVLVGFRVVIPEDQAWDGTTPLADGGPVRDGTGQGLFANGTAPVDLTVYDYTLHHVSIGNDQTVNEAVAANYFTTSLLNGYTMGFAPFLDTTPFEFWVTQDGLKGGLAPGGAAGEATIYVVTIKASAWVAV